MIAHETDLRCILVKTYLPQGRIIHAKAPKRHNFKESYMTTALINMYSKCGRMTEAREVFESVHKPDSASWRALLLGYVDNGQGHLALDVYFRMKAAGCIPDSFTYVAVFKACKSFAVNGDYHGCLKRVREIHSEIGCHMNHYVQTTLVDLYSKCGCMVDARLVFNSIQSPDVLCWTSLLSGYAENGEASVTLQLFSKMKEQRCAPNSFTYVAVVKACTYLAVSGDKDTYLKLGKDIHLQIGCHMNHYVKCALIEMYAKCGSMTEARAVFDSLKEPGVLFWTTLILGYAENGEELFALDMFSKMKKLAIFPDSFTYVAALKACTSIARNGDKSACLQRGRGIHSEVGRHMNHYVQATLIDMYATGGSMEEAHRVFDNMLKPDIFSWTALLAGYADNGEGHLALHLFSKMKVDGFKPDSVTYLALIKACGSIGALALGRKIHSEISDFSMKVVTCLVDFYAKCGSMVEAREVFELHPRTRDVGTWNALIAGYSKFGNSDTVFNLFEAMKGQRLQPDSVTFVCLLICCSHAGLVEKAKAYFDELQVKYQVTPSLVHYNCMVDVLGRANRLNQALKMIQEMPFSPDAVTWTTLLGACSKWKNVEMGKEAFKRLADLDKGNARAYVLMARLYDSRDTVTLKNVNYKEI